jgi:malto-oligosyltrehalose trehalohydrolase
VPDPESTQPTSLDAAASQKQFRIFPKTWGSEFVRDGEVLFRLWAPQLDTVSLRIEDADQEMSPAGGGWFELLATGLEPDTRYSFVLPDGRVVPDPASRSQDGGIAGPSIVTDPTAYAWRHPEWRGRDWEEAIFYELHIGTFTPEGTFRAAIDKLPHLEALGITAIEVMPVAQFPGERGWGYDGVLLYAPHHAYGPPDDFKAFIDAAHARGMMVFLDVVYNHFGPEGNYLPLYAKSFFDRHRRTPWGDAIDFTERPVRDFFIENALYWLLEYNLDGLRLDAVHAIEDEGSDLHFVAELANRIREECQGRRRHLVIEDSRNMTRFLTRDRDAAPLVEAGWNDDFHHALHVIATGETGGYFAPFATRPFESLGAALARGYVQTTEEPVRLSSNRTVAAPAALPPTAYVVFMQNHDQIGNRAYGDRLGAIAEPATIEALEAITILSPSIPLLFMGEEFDETRPFHFFCDYRGAIARAIRQGRLAEAVAFGSLPAGSEPSDLPDPCGKTTFDASRLDWSRPATREGRQKLERMATLIAIRKQHILPGLREVEGFAGRLIQADAGQLAIDWKLNGFVLELRANLSRNEAPIRPFRGDVFHTVPATTETATGRIGPMTVIFAKRPG